MFKCEKCRRQSLPGEKQLLVVVETTPADYPLRKRNGEVVDLGGSGRNIVRTMKVHSMGCGDERTAYEERRASEEFAERIRVFTLANERRIALRSV